MTWSSSTLAKTFLVSWKAFDANPLKPCLQVHCFLPFLDMLHGITKNAKDIVVDLRNDALPDTLESDKI